MTGTAKVITIKKGEEFQIRRGSVYEENGFFYDSYQKASKVIEEIVKRKQDNTDESQQRLGAFWGEEEYVNEEYANNVIAFCADRGEGKSSAMKTFSESLERMQALPKAEHQKTDAAFWGEATKKACFKVLPSVDPGMMGEQTSVLRIILSRILLQARYQWKMQDEKMYLRQSSRESRNEILKKIQECYACLDTLGKKECSDYDDLEELAALGDSTNLRSKFIELVKLYLRDQGSSEAQKNFLVIQIDDADIEVTKAYGILEDIRKYCMIPQVIILMALDLNLIYKVLDQHYLKDFSALISSDERMRKSCHEMAVRYLGKVLPASHQIHLPSINEELKSGARNLVIRYLDAEEKDILQTDETICEGYQEQLLNFIYKKTGIALVRPTSFRHNVLPGHMRELTHFLALFSEMQDLDDSMNPMRIFDALTLEPESDKRKKAREELQKRRKNLKIFENYFLKTWSELYLPSENRAALKAISDAAPYIKNRVVQEQYSIFKESDNFGKLDDGIPDVTRLSMAYSLRGIQKLSERAAKDEDYRVCYAARLYYTLFMNQCLLAAVEDRDQMKKMVQFVGMEAWTPDYSSFVSTRFSCGRVEIDLKTLSTAKEKLSFKDDPDLEHLVFVMDKNNEKSIAYRKSQKLEGKVVFDLNYMLLQMACGEGALYFEDNAKPECLDCASDLLQIFFNWDLQHYLEKEAEREPAKEMGSSELCEVVQKYLKRLSEGLSKLNYIPQTWTLDKVEIENSFFKGTNNVLYGNKKYIVALAGEKLEGLKKMSPDDSKSWKESGLEKFEGLKGNFDDELNKMLEEYKKYKKEHPRTDAPTSKAVDVSGDEETTSDERSVPEKTTDPELEKKLSQIEGREGAK